MNKRRLIGKLVLFSLFLFVILAVIYPSVFYQNDAEKLAKSWIVHIIIIQLHTFKDDKKYADSKPLHIKNEQQVERYQIEMESDSNSFKVWATPIEYGKRSKLSFYADSLSGDIRGADHQGAKASGNDPVVEEISDEIRNELKQNSSPK